VSKVEKTEYLLARKTDLLFLCCFHFLHCFFGFALFYYLSLSSCNLLVHFLFVVYVSNFVLFL